VEVHHERRYLDPKNRRDKVAGMSVPTGIDGDAPALARHEILVQAPIDAIWQLHVDVDDWPTWQTEITDAKLTGPFEPGASFEWTSSGFTVTSTIYDVSPPGGEVSPRSRTLWGGTAQGITGIHEWTFRDMTQGVLVATNESFAGAPVDGDPSTMQSILDESLVSWLLHLKAAAEARA
jgi:Polyketide cyclase / dehydrase and lipid transport